MWMCGCVAVWPCGRVALWLCGCGCVAVAVWPCGCVALRNNLCKLGEKANQIGGLGQDYGNTDGRAEGYEGCRKRQENPQNNK